MEVQVSVPAVQARAVMPAMTRRQLLAGTGQIALLAMLPTACAPAASIAWADGTFWDDGLGWTV